jgi:ABC-type dipeptide/oligopeptide/nickel transport system permease component
MLRVAAGRLPFLVLLVLSAFLGAWLLTALAPGDPAYAMLQQGHGAYARERARLGLDRPVGDRLLERLRRAAAFDFGTSSRFARPVLPLVVERASATLVAGSLALGCALLVGIPAGVATARLRWPLAARAVSVVSLTIVSVPSLVAALVLVVAFSRLRVPTLVIVVLALALPAAALIERLQTSAYREVAGGMHVLAARARGVSDRRAAWRHAWPLSLPAVLGVVSLVASQLVSGSLAVEFVTGYPGLGRLTHDALTARDADLAAGCAAAAAALVGLASLAADVPLAAIDPRVSASS